jgi:hypothetical protein
MTAACNRKNAAGLGLHQDREIERTHGVSSANGGRQPVRFSGERRASARPVRTQ